jgi:N utilization substance protein A
LCFELGRATVVVNEDQLSLAIGKRGQNVRLAARLTGWDIDILTPPEFQNGVTRLDQTLKAIEGITQEMVDKVIALGLIDVRDIEEVGTGPLMEELALSEETAEFVVDKCAAEAKIVAVEQEAKKKADAAEKAKIAAALGGSSSALANPLGVGGGDSSPFGSNPLLRSASASEGEEPAAEAPSGDAMPQAMEATAGIASEIATHNESSLNDGGDLSPEERAMKGPNGESAADDEAGDAERKEYADEEGDTAALAEGRLDPPAASKDEPV